MAVKFADAIYGERYSVLRGFYKERVGVCLVAEKATGDTPARAKLRLVGTIHHLRPFPPDLVVDVWVDLADLEWVQNVSA